EVIGEHGDVEIHFAVAVVVPGGNPHGCLRQPCIGKSESGDITYILEGSVFAVAVQVARSRIVGHRQIEPPVIIYVNKDRGESVVILRVRNAGLLAHIGESTITVVVEEMVALAWQAARPAHSRHSSELTPAG